MDPVSVALITFGTEVFKCIDRIEERISADPTMAAEMNKLLLDRLTRANKRLDWIQDKVDKLLHIAPDSPAK